MTVQQDVDFEIERLIPIRGRGTVVVGTVVAGEIRVGHWYELRGVAARCDAVEIGRRLVQLATKGERVGVLLAASIPEAG